MDGDPLRESAELMPRVIAGLFDCLIGVVAFVIIAAAQGTMGSVDNGNGSTGYRINLDGDGTAIWLAVVLAYYAIFEMAWGWTPGKRLVSLRIVDGRGEKPHPVRILVRTIARVVDGFPAFYLLGFIIAALTPGRRRLGDLLAGTHVVPMAALRDEEPLLDDAEDSRVSTG